MKVVYENDGGEMPEELKQEVNRAAKMPVSFDEDCPELSQEQLEQLKKAARIRNRSMHKGNLQAV